jgi:hypothetical protein
VIEIQARAVSLPPGKALLRRRRVVISDLLFLVEKSEAMIQADGEGFYEGNRLVVEIE